MLKKLAIVCAILAGAYALASGDYTFASPRYRVLALAYLAAAQFSSPRVSADDLNGAESGQDGAGPRPAVGAPPARTHAYVHLGSLRTAASARQEWLRLQRTFPTELANLDLTVERVDLGPKGVFYRVLADTFASPLSARQLCSELRQSRQFCAPIHLGAT